LFSLSRGKKTNDAAHRDHHHGTCAAPTAPCSRAAGFPSPADDFVEEEIDLQRLLIRNRPATFLVRVAGNSMTGKQLYDGDLAIVDRSLSPRPGDVVVVDIDGERSFKVWNVRAGRIELSFANPRYPQFKQPQDATLEVWGVVSSSITPRRRALR
jgi:DNA polymerase V